MRETRDHRSETGEPRRESPSAGAADRGDHRVKDQLETQPSPGHPLKEHSELHDSEGHKVGTSDRRVDKFENGGTKETTVYKDSQGHETGRKEERTFADGRTETKTHTEELNHEARKITTDTTVTKTPDGASHEHTERKDSTGHTTYIYDNKSWKDANGNGRHDTTYDYPDAKPGQNSHIEHHEVYYNKDSGDGMHKKGDQEETTVRQVKH